MYRCSRILAGLAVGLACALYLPACSCQLEMSSKRKTNDQAVVVDPDEKPAMAKDSIPSPEARAVVAAMQGRGKGPENLATADGIHKLYLTHETTFVPFGGDTNSRPPTVFGGKLFSEMDRLAAIAAKRLLYAVWLPPEYGVVTLVVNNLKFARPARVGDMLVVSSTIHAVGEKSITVRVTIEREFSKAAREVVTSGEFVMVTVDEKGNSVAHGLPKFGTQETK